MTTALSPRGAQEIAPREPRFGEMMLDDVIEGPEQSEAGRFELPGEQGLLPGAKSPSSQLDIVPGDLREDGPHKGHVRADEVSGGGRVEGLRGAEPLPVCRGHPRPHEMRGEPDTTHHGLRAPFQKGARQAFDPVWGDTHVVVGECNDVAGRFS